MTNGNITREFSQIKGIDAQASPSVIDADRAVSATDLFPENGRLVTRPALVHAGVFKKPVEKAKGAFGIYSVGDKVLLRLGAYMLEWLCFPNVNGLSFSGDELISDGDYTVLASSLSSRISENPPLSADATVEFDDALIVYNGNGVFRFGKDGTSVYTPSAALSRMNAVASVSEFSAIAERDAPLICRDGKYLGAKNMLSPCFRVSVTADGESKTFVLGKSGAKMISCVYTFEGTEVFKTLSDGSAGSVTLPSIPDKNTQITVLCRDPDEEKTVREPLTKAFGAVFDGRVFLCAAAESGASGRVIFSAEGDPFFFRENAVCAGSEGTQVFAEVGKYLAAIERAGAAAPLIRFHYPRTAAGDALGKEYPAEYGLYDCGVTGTGNAVHHLGSPLFVSEDGVKRIVPAAVNDTSSLRSASEGIDGLLKRYSGTPRLTAFNGTALLSVGTDLFVSRDEAKNGRTGKKENGWFLWTNIGSESGAAPFAVQGIGSEKNGKAAVLSGTADGDISVEYLGADADADFEGTDAERTIEPTLITATEDFGDKTRMKRLEKRGCSFGADEDVRLFIVPDPTTDEEGAPVTDGFEVRPYGANGRYAFRPTDAAGRGFCAVVKGRGRTEIGDIVLKARKTKPIGGRRLK